MYVIKRNGSKQEVHMDKITNRLLSLSKDLKSIDVDLITQKAGSSLIDGMTTSDLEEHTSSISASMITIHFEYSILAARIAISNHQKQIPSKFSDCVQELHNYTCKHTGRSISLINKILYDLVFKDKEATSLIDSSIDSKKDFILNFFGFQTLKKSYFLKKSGIPLEGYSYLLMRVALFIHAPNVGNGIKAYNYMLGQYYTHATPTLFNSGLQKPSLASCFLVSTKSAERKEEEKNNSNIDIDQRTVDMMDSVKNAALISKHAGGLGIAASSVPVSEFVSYLSVLNSTMRYADQGGSRRPGACAIYLEPWHAEVKNFISLRKNTGNEDRRCRDLFLALWIPDLFMECVREDREWYLFCPSEAPGLDKVYGEEFETLYKRYVEEKRHRGSINARGLLKEVCRCQIETGGPFMLYKDTSNRFSNQNNLGVIKSSNLCTEIVEYSDNDETAVCNLASLNLRAFISDKFDRMKRLKDYLGDSEGGLFDFEKYYDFEKLHEVTKFLTLSLNKVIDKNYYPTEETQKSNLKHRPIGIGVQGLANVFYEFKVAYGSEISKKLNLLIFETIYHACLESSVELAGSEGPYESFQGSLYSRGIFHFEHYISGGYKEDDRVSGRYDWERLRERMVKAGLRNSLFTCCMPTASTAQILGNVESMEAAASNLYVRRVLAGDFVYVNESLLADLTELGMWNEEVKNKLMKTNGSVVGVEDVPEKLQDIYKTVWEIPQKSIIDMAADRSLYLDQSQSLNIFMRDPSLKKVYSMHMYGWEKGLKTGMYYLRTQAATEAIKFTVSNNKKMK